MRDNIIKYPFAPTYGAFYFFTDEGCTYAIKIVIAGYELWKSEMLYSDESLFKLQFSKTCDDGDPGLDDAICNTITSIFISNILSKGDTCVYYHILEKGEGYNKLYEHFYNDIEKQTDFEVNERTASEGNGEDAYSIAVIIHKNHPDRDIIIQEFENAIGGN